MCLHAGPDQSQGVARQLAAGAGHGATRQQDQDARVGTVGAVPLEVGVLQRLQEAKGVKSRHALTGRPRQNVERSSPRTPPGRCPRME